MTLPAVTAPAPQPPAWAVLDPDDDGAAVGPFRYIGPLGVLTGWTVEEGKLLWLDTTQIKGSMDLPPADTRLLIETLTEYLALVSGPATASVRRATGAGR
jgi:hypothetical protein